MAEERKKNIQEPKEKHSMKKRSDIVCSPNPRAAIDRGPSALTNAAGKGK